MPGAKLDLGYVRIKPHALLSMTDECVKVGANLSPVWGTEVATVGLAYTSAAAAFH